MAEYMMLDPGRVDDVGVEAEKRFTIRKVKRCFGVNLTPDEHVFGCERDQLIAFTNVRPDGFHDLIFWKIDLRIQVRQAELATSSAPGGHLDYAESGSLVGEKNAFARSRMFDFDFARQSFAANRLAKQLECVERLAAPFDHAIDAELVIQIGLNNLPTA